MHILQQVNSLHQQALAEQVEVNAMTVVNSEGKVRLAEMKEEYKHISAELAGYVEILKKKADYLDS